VLFLSFARLFRVSDTSSLRGTIFNRFRPILLNGARQMKALIAIFSLLAYSLTILDGKLIRTI